MSEGRVAIIGDSWTSVNRLKPSLVDNSALELNPHTGSNIEVSNYSLGSLTWSKLLKDQGRLKKWALSYPRVTLVHLGGVELANGQILKGNEKTPIGRFVGESIENNILTLISKAATYQDEARNQEWIKEKIIVLVAIPDWHNFKGHPQSLPADQVRSLRRKINLQLSRLMVTLWRVHRVILVKPHINHPRIIGVHLHPEDQAIYNDQLMEVVKKSLCRHCKLENYEPKKNLMNLKLVQCPRQPVNQNN